MTKNSILAAIFGISLALVAVGCTTPANNANTNTNANRNTIVVTNSNTNTHTAANDNANRAVSRADYERDKDRYSKEAKESGSKIGQGADDLWLWTKTRAALAAADDLRDSTINVDVDNAVVTLRGNVASNDQKSRAAQVAQGVEGVKSVKNTLAVSASGAAKTDNSNKGTNTKKG